MITMQAITLEVNNQEVTLAEKELVDIVASYYASQEKAARDAKLVAEREERDRQIMQTKPKQVLTALEGQKIVLVQVSDDGKAVVIYSDTDSADEETDGESDVDNSDVDIGEDADEADIEEEFDDYCSKDTSDDQASSEASSSNSGESVSRQEENSTTAELYIVGVEDISLDDEFMKYRPHTEVEHRVMNNIVWAKDMDLKNFGILIDDTSLSKDKRDAFEKGTDLHKDLFSGIVIKYLVEEEKCNISDAWKMVLHNHKKLKNYLNSSKDGRTGNSLILWYNFATMQPIEKNFIITNNVN